MSLNGCFRSWRATQNHARPISMKRGLIVGEHPSRVVAAGRGLNLFAMSLNGCFRSWRATQNHARPILVKRGLIVGEHSSKGCWIVIGLFFWGGQGSELQWHVSKKDNYSRLYIWNRKIVFWGSKVQNLLGLSSSSSALWLIADISAEGWH